MSDSREELLAAWESHKKASQEAKELMHEAEAHFNNCIDTERRSWLALEEHDRAERRGR